MKLKACRVLTFIHKDDFGVFKFSDVEILFDPEVNEITAENFNQEEQEYFLSDSEIQKLTHESAIRFYNSRAKEIHQKTHPLLPLEVKGIMDFLGVSGAGLGDLIGIDKSSISRVINGKQVITNDKEKSLMNSLKEEIQSPGYNRIVLSNIKGFNLPDSFEELGVDVSDIAEYFIRKFDELQTFLAQLKLQKLLYYAQGIGFGRYGVKLFNEPLLAWKHGPVVESIYDKYKKYKRSPLERTPNTNISSLIQNEVISNILEETITIYGIYDAWVLRTKTHNEFPWLETDCNDVITDEKMFSFLKNINLIRKAVCKKSFS